MDKKEDTKETKETKETKCVMSGKEFRQRYPPDQDPWSAYVKLTTVDHRHGRMTYKEGLNCLPDNEPFRPHGTCEPGGLYFTFVKYIPEWLIYNDKIMVYVWDVELDDNCQVYIDEDKDKSKFKCDQFRLSHCRPIRELDIWKNVKYCNLAVQYSSPYLPLLFMTNEIRNAISLCWGQYTTFWRSCEKWIPSVLKYWKPDIEFVVKVWPQLLFDFLPDIPKEYKTEFVYLKVVSQNGMLLKELDYKQRTLDVCFAAIKNDVCAIAYVPPKCQTPTLCMKVVSVDGSMLKYIDESRRTLDICLAAMKDHAWRAFKYVPVECQTPELCIIVIEKCHGIGFLEDVHKTRRTLDVCRAAVKGHEDAMKYVPDKYKTEEFYMHAVREHGLALEYIPKTKQTKTMCHVACRKDPCAIRYARWRTKDMCLDAVRRNPNVIYFGWKFNEDETFANDVYTLALELDPTIYTNIPKDWWTESRLQNLIKREPRIKDLLSCRFVYQNWQSGLYEFFQDCKGELGGIRKQIERICHDTPYYDTLVSQLRNEYKKKRKCRRHYDLSSSDYIKSN